MQKHCKENEKSQKYRGYLLQSFVRSFTRTCNNSDNHRDKYLKVTIKIDNYLPLEKLV